MSTAPVKPWVLPPIIETIPDELRRLRRWVVWKLVFRPTTKRGKPWTKTPHDPKNGRHAKTTDRATWGSFSDAWSAYQVGDYDGIGFVFCAEDDVIGIDLDNCRDAITGTLESWAEDIVDRFPTYAEVSASGTGVHLICRGKLPPGRRRKGNVEMYSEVRYFAFTGRTLEMEQCELS